MKLSFPRSSSASALCFSLLTGTALACASGAEGQALWSGYAGNPQHTALSSVPSQSLGRIVWQTPVDLQPPYSGNDLLIHYGSALVTLANTVLVPVKTGLGDGFRVEARRGSDGTLLWSFDSDYSLPPHNWIPSYGPVLTPSGRVYLAGAGGTVYCRDNVDSALPSVMTQTAFYGNAAYNANKTAFNGAVKICTPLTSDAGGNVFFGYQVLDANPLNLTGGVARIGADGSTNFVAASALSGGDSDQVTMNCAPALSNDGKLVYVTTRDGNGSGYLVSFNAATLAPVSKVRLKDPRSGNDSRLLSDGTASPMVAPDGAVFIGVIERPFASSKGWMLQFNAGLTQEKTPGAFGWDDTPSLVPVRMVPAYHGSSSYLLMTKYNNYASLGGDGVNRIAILDPNDTQTDARTGATVMKEVMTIAGVTPDAEFINRYPNAVREWCINTAVVDPATGSVLVNSEDGKLYRWRLMTNTFTEQITLTQGIGEAYTPTLIGRDGKVYAINNATLFAVGAAAAPPAYRVSGTLSLEGISPDAPAQPITLNFRRPRTLDCVANADVRSDGAFSVSGIPPGNYTLHVKGRQYLAKNVSVSVVNTDVVLPSPISLRTGDVNNNNIVDVDDLTLLLDRYNSGAGDGTYSSNADLNLNGQIDVDDLTLLLNNYNTAGNP